MGVKKIKFCMINDPSPKKKSLPQKLKSIWILNLKKKIKKIVVWMR